MIVNQAMSNLHKYQNQKAIDEFGGGYSFTSSIVKSKFCIYISYFGECYYCRTLQQGMLCPLSLWWKFGLFQSVNLMVLDPQELQRGMLYVQSLYDEGTTS